MAKNARMNITIMNSTKAALQAYCEDHDNLNMGDVVDIALVQYLTRHRYITGDDKLEKARINQLLMSNMNIAQGVGFNSDMLQAHEDKLDRILELLERK